MEFEYNELGQPVGLPVPGWSPRPGPPRTAMTGRFCTVAPLDPERHAGELLEAYAEDREGRLWTYLPRGPFASLEEYRHWAENGSREAPRGPGSGWSSSSPSYFPPKIGKRASTAADADRCGTI